jgi:DNA-directed RNA polymerase subunit RPC12/RpoP
MTPLDIHVPKSFLKEGLGIICNKCQEEFYPYTNSDPPTLDEVACPKCGEKRILYQGNDPNILKEILSRFSVGKETAKRIGTLEERIEKLEDATKSSLESAREIMTETLRDAVRQEIRTHERGFHNYGKRKR